MGSALDALERKLALPPDAETEALISLSSKLDTDEPMELAGRVFVPSHIGRGGKRVPDYWRKAKDNEKGSAAKGVINSVGRTGSEQSPPYMAEHFKRRAESQAASRIASRSREEAYAQAGSGSGSREQAYSTLGAPKSGESRDTAYARLQQKLDSKGSSKSQGPTDRQLNNSIDRHLRARGAATSETDISIAVRRERGLGLEHHDRVKNMVQARRRKMLTGSEVPRERTREHARSYEAWIEDQNRLAGKKVERQGIASVKRFAAEGKLSKEEVQALLRWYSMR